MDKLSENRMHKTIFLKMMINYLQIISLVKDVNLSWPFDVRSFFEAQSKIGDASNQILSFDCLLSNYTTDIVYMKMLIVFFLPMIATVALMAFFFILSVIMNAKVIGYLINSIIITYFLLQPIVINVCFNILSCKELDQGSYYISSYLTTQCYTETYYIYVI